MGYFRALYTVDIGRQLDKLFASTIVYGGERDNAMYLSFGPGQRPNGLHSYANGSVVSSTELFPLGHYPCVEECPPHGIGYLVEITFTPERNSDSTLLCITLPSRHIPLKNEAPFEQPTSSFSWTHEDRVIVAYPVSGTVSVRFVISEIPANRSLENYEISDLFRTPASTPVKRSVEFNLGILKFKFEV